MPEARLTRDPTGDVAPDFTSAAFEEVRQAVMERNGISEEEAADTLLASWTRHQEEKVQRWEQQQREDEDQELNVDQPRDIRPANSPAPSSRPARRNLSPAPEKKRKINPIQRGKQVATARLPQPSAYALKKLRNFDYVELWYFTEKGCEEAQNGAISAPTDVFTLSRVAGTLALKSLDASTASRAVIPDEKLSWRDVSVAQKLLLHHMKEQGWPEEHVSTLATFFFRLEYHDIRRTSSLGDDVIVRYQAEIRREWHRLITSPKEQNVFDIGDISLDRLDEIERRLIKQDQMEYTAR
ncbi:hypothetical protein AGABI1DRAFT_46743 [Agaricus bisporus var. burnettii JB137-S8]|uniref:Uncharacterized protein n=1 Tax=Agaricus bisporus var. burnettii (strain JB137-S8 / ATCC MYA-4627 / FGSC 10392) TaxID=597362 RepID=K5WXG0_AGABU|nr:uncharacterized protein AGABI1DRAFT_46743 [Agaricus bisporus var. burnettii JB137-S8]EKM75267.1 hypothetical protein AGABI1DRAFT_46743 [Agaricus bisporus var. burnettii JB137-S8]